MPNEELVPVTESGEMDISRRIDEDLYAIADKVIAEDELALYPEEFYRYELAKDTEGLVYRPPVLGINHTAGTFDLTSAGVSDYSPNTLMVQIIDHARNRALWHLEQSKENKMPLCSSRDCVTGSAIAPNGENVKCAKCVYGQWWQPRELLQLAGVKGEKSPYANALFYLNKALSKADTSVEKKAAEAPPGKIGNNLPPPCKEVRRVFMFAYDHAKKGVLNQPVVLQVPTSSIANFDKYCQDLTIRTIRTASGTRPLVLILVITKLTLEKAIGGGSKQYSLLNFEYDRVATSRVTNACLQIRKERADQVMNFQMTMADFDTESAVDPTSLADLPSINIEDVQLGPTMELDD